MKINIQLPTDTNKYICVSRTVIAFVWRFRTWNS